MSPALRILDPGLFATVQDVGRFGHQSAGVAVCGALDQTALRLANLLVGNAPTLGTIECLYRGLTMQVEADSLILGTAGGEADISVTSLAGTKRHERAYTSFIAHRGDTVRVGNIRTSCSLYLAVAGGFDIAPHLGSVSTDIRARIGGLNGEALSVGDRLPIKDDIISHMRCKTTLLRLAPIRDVRVILGPQDDYFDAKQIASFLEQSFCINARSNRMAIALDGDPIEPLKGFNIISDAIANGSIQISGSGLPAILLADRQTTGGYPKIATVISADIAALGRLPVGSVIRFVAISQSQAIEAARQLKNFLDDLETHLINLPHDSSSHYDQANLLLSQNLISGVFNASEVA